MEIVRHSQTLPYKQSLKTTTYCKHYRAYSALIIIETYLIAKPETLSGHGI